MKRAFIRVAENGLIQGTYLSATPPPQTGVGAWVEVTDHPDREAVVNQHRNYLWKGHAVAKPQVELKLSKDEILCDGVDYALLHFTGVPAWPVRLKLGAETHSVEDNPQEITSTQIGTHQIKLMEPTMTSRPIYLKVLPDED